MKSTARVRSARDLGAAVAEARQMRGLTQAELSEITGLHRSYLAKIESGASVVLLDRLFRVLRRLGVEVTVTLPEPTGTEQQTDWSLSANQTAAPKLPGGHDAEA